VGAIIVTENPDVLTNLPHGTTVFLAPSNDALQGSSAAAQVLINQTIQRHPIKISTAPPLITPLERIGVFICKCGGLISNFIDTDAVLEQASQLQDVAHTQVLQYACSSDAGDRIQTEIEAYALDRVVLAACSCCNIDQVCFSCTYQRMRCKGNLGLFAPIHNDGRLSLKAVDCARFEFVNIREQCAWIHQEDIQVATEKTSTLIASTVGRIRAAPGELAGSRSIDRSAIILGNGPAASICEKTFPKQGIDVKWVTSNPRQVQRSGGLYKIMGDDQTWQASTLVLAPKNESESKAIITAFGRERRQPQLQKAWGGLETHRPGIFYISPQQNPEISGKAATARVNAWIGRSENRPPTAAVVDPKRCRGCKTCIDTCEYCAPELIEIDGRYSSWIDPAICTSCGTCAAHCPSGAITAGCSTDAQLEAMLDEILT
jgi:heterodisulfide reductase subunit A-like polyferredoxin